MIATSRFVFLHLHKSGGTFVNQWLLRFFPDARQLGYHLPRRLIPPPLAHLPVVGLVRNPWSYYVSWYAFQSSMVKPNLLFRTLSDGGRLGFEGTIRNMLELGGESSCIDQLVAALPASYGTSGLNLPGPELAAIKGTGLGFYSFLYRYMYGDDPIHVARMEHMRDELAQLVGELDAEPSATALSYLAAAPATNASAHGAYAGYYDAALRDLVADRDAAVIDAHSYRFGD